MFKFSRILIIYAIAAPLALVLGYLVSAPNSFNFAAIGMVVFFLALPLLLKWHHLMLIFFWNAVLIAFFLPGKPDMWIVFAALSFGISILNHILFQKKFLRAPELTRPLIFLTVVVLITAQIRGGIGLHAFGGSSAGGRYYVYILLAIAGYFAFTSEQIPLAKGKKMGELFFLSGLFGVLPNIVYVMGPAFYFLYLLIPSGGAMGQAQSAAGMTDIDRISGLGGACTFALCVLLARYGIRALFDWSKPWRLGILLFTIVASMFSGFRSQLIMLILIFSFEFYFEGLMRTHLLPVFIGMAITAFGSVLLFSDSMPHSVQRAISFLPVKVDTEVLEDAQGSLDWRLAMWAEVVKEVPKYLLIGKGYGLNTAELMNLNDALRVGVPTPYTGYDPFIMAGDYHSGPLSVIIPFGIFGTVAFLWALIAGGRVLYSNYRYGDSKLRRVNTVLLSYYLATCISFFFIFGALNSELMVFTGIWGISVSLNGGVKKKVAIKRKPVAAPQTLAMQPGNVYMKRT